MPIPSELQDAVKTAVANNDQPEAVAKRLLAWLEELSTTGNLENAAEVSKSLATIRGALSVELPEDEQ